MPPPRASANGGGFFHGRCGLFTFERLSDNAPVNEQTLIEIIVNGEPQQIVTGATVTELIQQLALTPERLAIELNLNILPRTQWAVTRLQAGDQLEIVHFVGGG